MASSQRIYKWSVCAWATFVLVHLAFNLLTWWNIPPSDEVYTNGVGFQIIAFTVVSLPYWLGALLVVLLLEFAVFGRKASLPSSLQNK